MAVKTHNAESADETVDEIMRLGFLLHKDALKSMEGRAKKRDVTAACYRLRRAAEKLTSVSNSADEIASVHGLLIKR